MTGTAPGGQANSLRRAAPGRGSSQAVLVVLVVLVLVLVLVLELPTSLS